MARPNSTLFCLSDSTAYGLLPTSSLVGAGSVVDTETQCVMVISCGGSLVKEASTGKSIMELFQKYLSEATGLPSDDTPVVCGCVPAERSVPNRSWAVLQDHRKGYNLRETSQTILDLCPDSYNTKGMHFNRLKAAAAMRLIIKSVSEELLQGQPDGCIAVIICTGWNIKKEDQM